MADERRVTDDGGTRVVEREHHAGDDRGTGRGAWAGIALGVVALLVLILLAIWAFADDGIGDDDGGTDVSQSVAVDAEDEGTTGEGSTADEGASFDEGDAGEDASASTGDQVLTLVREDDDGGTTTIDASDVIRVPAPSGDAGDAEASATIEDGGAEADADTAAAEPRTVQVLVDETSDLEQLDGATLRMPGDTDVTFDFENATDTQFNAYLEPSTGDELLPAVASMEPFIEADSQVERSFTTPGSGSYTLRIEDADGETIMEGTLEIG